MAWHVDLAVLALDNVGLQLLTYLGPEHVLLGPLLDPGEVPPVVGKVDHFHTVPEGLWDH